MLILSPSSKNKFCYQIKIFWIFFYRSWRRSDLKNRPSVLELSGTTSRWLKTCWNNLVSLRSWSPLTANTQRHQKHKLSDRVRTPARLLRVKAAFEGIEVPVSVSFERRVILQEESNIVQKSLRSDVEPSLVQKKELSF